jgi:hypothetical protein
LIMVLSSFLRSDDSFFTSSLPKSIYRFSSIICGATSITLKVEWSAIHMLKYWTWLGYFLSPIFKSAQVINQIKYFTMMLINKS